VPQSIRVHPLSRYGPETIAVHLVFEDGDGFECRAIGTLIVTLSGANIKDTVKTIDLTNFGINRERFDGLTRTYLVRFNEVPTDLSKVQVSVTFSPESGTKLRANGTIDK